MTYIISVYVRGSKAMWVGVRGQGSRVEVSVWLSSTEQPCPGAHEPSPAMIGRQWLAIGYDCYGMNLTRCIVYNELYEIAIGVTSLWLPHSAPYRPYRPWDPLSRPKDVAVVRGTAPLSRCGPPSIKNKKSKPEIKSRGKKHINVDEPVSLSRLLITWGQSPCSVPLLMWSFCLADEGGRRAYLLLEINVLKGYILVIIKSMFSAPVGWVGCIETLQ